MADNLRSQRHTFCVNENLISEFLKRLKGLKHEILRPSKDRQKITPFIILMAHDLNDDIT